MKQLLSAILVIAFAATTVSALEEGGYVGTRNNSEGHSTVVYNFLRHFNYEQYYYSQPFQFVRSNNSRVDAMDFAIFAGHGNRWLIETTNGNVNLATAGNTNNEGYGDMDLEFIAFESCKVVPSRREVTNWWAGWINGDGIFDGLHQALGFRTNSYQSTDQQISDYFGIRIKNCGKVWSSWFDAINMKGNGIEFGSVVLHPSTVNDTYCSWSADPPANHTNLYNYHQY